MKVILFVKLKTFLYGCGLLALLAFTPTVFAQTASSDDSRLLLDIQKKLEESQKREELILTNQDKILEEIIKSRKWMHR